MCVCVHLHHLDGVLCVAHLRGGDGGVVGVGLQAAHVGRVPPVTSLEINNILHYFMKHLFFYINIIILSWLG